MPSRSTVISFTAPRTEVDSVEAEKVDSPKELLERIAREVHGKGPPLMKETDELLRSSLGALKKELAVSKSAEYNRAATFCPEYVKSDDFLLMFLRADRFNVQEVARRVEKYWGDRLRLFGDEVAFQPRPIRLTDLSDEDLATLRSTGLQLLPIRDKAGRALILSTRRKWSFEDRKDVGRLVWYLFHAALEDVGVQRNGVVVLAYDDGPIQLELYDRKPNC
uniref:CRAL/TRIO N-terminal domain-containing protein n=1 Tax=Grammatophora oceanica TaxID=210454 RepID=A0A7S1Y5C0_9STRA|mmetsp:Transcript_22780/g.33778  ORF Transcript_22780/g.33778 Transcript_22780/m.33778 type:complete len:221 (+) Transcript_22780:158-820(+)